LVLDTITIHQSVKSIDQFVTLGRKDFKSKTNGKYKMFVSNFYTWIKE